jgi:DNA-binding protein HU-beta
MSWTPYKEDAVPGRLRNPAPARSENLPVTWVARPHTSNGLALYGSVPRLRMNILARPVALQDPLRQRSRILRQKRDLAQGRPDHAGAMTTLRSSEPHKEEMVVPLTQTQLASAVADRAEITKAEAKRVLDALEDVVLEEIANAEKVKIGGLVQLTVRVKPASKARKGRNPATGEEITIAAKPASVDLRARALTKAKSALPSVQKARRRLS